VSEHFSIIEFIWSAGYNYLTENVLFCMCR